MSVHTTLRNSLAWLTIMSVFGHLTRYSSSQSTACKSKWFVGSSSSSKSGSTKSARASATRMRHPPLNVLVARVIMSGVNESPDRIMAARASAPYASISSSWE
mmetsp:Transcript_18986/g.32472  ORF Transcript_18986/g.32472 Transcript_18986/m.32472 type:complete len:103 (-) Transcript_18986:1129-1437(-)